MNREYPMPERTFAQEIFKLLLEKTEAFPFSKLKGEPLDASDEELRHFRLIDLVSRARKLAIRKYNEMPLSFRAARSQDEWISDAMTILCMESAKYKIKEGYYYNDYMAFFILPKRLTDIQRSMYRANPPVDEELRQIVSNMKHQLKRAPTAEEIADFTGISERRAQDFLDVGVGVRICVSRGEIDDPDRWSEAEDYSTIASPLQICLRREFRRIVLGCIRKLTRKERHVIVRTYFFDKSIADIAKRLSEKYATVKTRHRRAVSSLKECVQDRYAIHMPAQGAANG